MDKYINFVLNAILGKNPDEYFRSHSGEINYWANKIRTKFPIPIDTIYRGILLDPEEVKISINWLKPWSHVSYLSFSESIIVAQEFANPKSDISDLVMLKYPKHEGYLIKYKPKIEEILFSWRWAKILSFDKFLVNIPNAFNCILEQKEVILRQEHKTFDLVKIL